MLYHAAVEKGWHNFLIRKQLISVMPSSVIAAIQYDTNSSTLQVVYVSGSVYHYKNVPEEVYNEMKKAFSKGEFLNKQIKPNYGFEKIK